MFEKKQKVFISWRLVSSNLTDDLRRAKASRVKMAKLTREVRKVDTWSLATSRVLFYKITRISKKSYPDFLNFFLFVTILYQS
jgi:hypothetical protein